jgi:hypothetical protein
MMHEMNKLSLSTITANSASNLLMGMIEHAHDYIQYVNFGAMLDNTIVIDGKVYNARKYVRESTDYRDRYNQSGTIRKEVESTFEDRVKALIDAHGIIGKSSIKDNKLVIEGLDMNHDSVAKFKGVVSSMGRKLSGNISSENESRLRMTVVGRQLLMFKNWLPGMVHTRFTGLSHNEGLQDYEWGRIRMLGKIVFQNGIKSVNRLVSMYRATEGGVDMMSKLYDQKKSDYEKDHREDFKMSREAFYDLIRKNIAQQSKEALAFAGLMGVYSSIMALAEDHKHDGTKGYWAFAERVLNRSEEEIGLYYNPISMNQIANGSMFPTLGFLTDMGHFMGAVYDDGLGHIEGDEKKVKNAHPAKYLMKNVPVFSQVPNYMAVMFPSLAEELGIQVNAKKVNK